MSGIAALARARICKPRRAASPLRDSVRGPQLFFSRARPVDRGVSPALNRPLEYAAGAMDRAAALGAEIIVLGSSGAKNVPRRVFPWMLPGGRSWNCSPPRPDGCRAKPERLQIEPLNRGDRTSSPLVPKACGWRAEANQSEHPVADRLLSPGDREGGPRIVVEAGRALRHVHFAKVEGRSFPDRIEEDYRRFFACLRQNGYFGNDAASRRIQPILSPTRGAPSPS